MLARGPGLPLWDAVSGRRRIRERRFVSFVQLKFADAFGQRCRRRTARTSPLQKQNIRDTARPCGVDNL